MPRATRATRASRALKRSITSRSMRPTGTNFVDLVDLIVNPVNQKSSITRASRNRTRIVTNQHNNLRQLPMTDSYLPVCSNACLMSLQSSAFGNRYEKPSTSQSRFLEDNADDDSGSDKEIEELFQHVVTKIDDNEESGDQLNWETPATLLNKFDNVVLTITKSKILHSNEEIFKKHLNYQRARENDLRRDSCPLCVSKNK